MVAVGTIFLIIGALMLLHPVIEAVIKFSNTIRGSQTKITKRTVFYYRLSAVIWIIFSLLIILGVIK